MSGLNSIRRAVATAVLSFVVLGASSAHAELFKFKLDAGQGSATWYQDSQPTPRQSDYFGHWTLINVSGTTTNRGPIDFLEYLDTNYYGPNQSAFAIFPSGGGYYGYLSQGLFTGTADAPVFHTGVFNLTLGDGAPEFSGAKLTVGPAAPAPLAGAGVLAALVTLAGLAAARPRSSSES